MKVNTAIVEVFQARSIRSKWRFRIRNANGQVTGQSSESYTRRADAFRGAQDFVASLTGGEVIIREVTR